MQLVAERAYFSLTPHHGLGPAEYKEDLGQGSYPQEAPDLKHGHLHLQGNKYL